MRRVRRCREHKSRVRFLTLEEVTTLLGLCRPNATLHAIVVTALSTGMRRGEIMGLRWRDVSFQRRLIVLVLLFQLLLLPRVCLVVGVRVLDVVHVPLGRQLAPC